MTPNGPHTRGKVRSRKKNAQNGKPIVEVARREHRCPAHHHADFSVRSQSQSRTEVVRKEFKRLGKRVAKGKAAQRIATKVD